MSLTTTLHLRAKSLRAAMSTTNDRRVEARLPMDVPGVTAVDLSADRPSLADRIKAVLAA